mmetsp:Transcript_18996/g.54463  ORF Transcript_18996/g.54463 Transcript_18996/m.54463 type:complete len:208 (-) Transcript_18996:1220-1843(-)
MRVLPHDVVVLQAGDRRVDEDCSDDVEQAEDAANHPDAEEQMEGRAIALPEDDREGHAILRLVVAEHEPEGCEHRDPHSPEEFFAVHIMHIPVAVLGSVAVLQVLVAQATLADQVLSILRPPHDSEGQTQNEQDDAKEHDDAKESRKPEHESGEHVREVLEEPNAQDLRQAEDTGDAQGAEQWQHLGRGARNGLPQQQVKAYADVHD